MTDKCPYCQSVLTQKRFVKPTVVEVKTYCQERGNNVDPEAFVDFYESKGWVVGKVKMKNWQASVRTWEKNRSNGNGKDQRSRAKRFSDKLDEIAKRDIEENGHTDKLG